MIHFRIWQLGRQEQRDLLQRMHKPTAKTCTLMFRNIQLTHIGQHHTGSLASRTLHKNFFISSDQIFYMRWDIVSEEKLKWRERGCDQEGYIEELTRLSQCQNAKTGFVYF